ncbi:MAG TPA: alpha/beta hydrolase [Anaerolineales bacterium]|nr:alpha/beta hydrolase [Anaerolineales bacterium]
MPTENGIYYFLSTRPGNPYPPVVLIHGAGGSHLSWGAEVRRLTGQDVYALDLPGHGKSGGHGEQTLSAYAQKIEAWMDAIPLHRAVFVGHSMGGGIAVELALRSPHRTAGLVLVSSGAVLPVRPDLLETSANPATFAGALTILRETAFGPEAGPRLVELALRRLAEIRPSVLHNDYLACAGYDASEKVGRIAKPSLVICGAEDRLTPLRYSQLLASRIEGAELRVIPGAGHMVTLEKPGELGEILGDFLKKQRPR